MAMNCCAAAPADEYVYDDYTRMTLSSGGSQTSAETDVSEVLNTDYRKVTPLFRNIERENWEGILTFLASGKWSSSMLASTSAHLRCPAPEIQVKTWVTAYDRNGNAEWSQLPLHAAISYKAPYVVIQKLVQLYPKAIHCTDNEGMLPVHLAFGFGAQDNILAMLMEPFPASVNEKGLGGRFPYECCELGPNKVRGRVYKTVTDQVIVRTRQQIDTEWREFATEAKKTVGLEANLEVSKKQLTDFILELLKDKKELHDIKKQRVLATQAQIAKTPTPVVANAKTPSKRMSRRNPAKNAATPKNSAPPKNGATPKNISKKKFTV